MPTYRNDGDVTIVVTDEYGLRREVTPGNTVRTKHVESDSALTQTSALPTAQPIDSDEASFDFNGLVEDEAPTLDDYLIERDTSDTSEGDDGTKKIVKMRNLPFVVDNQKSPGANTGGFRGAALRYVFDPERDIVEQMAEVVDSGIIPTGDDYIDLIVMPGTHTLTDDLTIPANCNLIGTLPRKCIISGESYKIIIETDGLIENINSAFDLEGSETRLLNCNGTAYVVPKTPDRIYVVDTLLYTDTQRRLFGVTQPMKVQVHPTKGTDDAGATGEVYIFGYILVEGGEAGGFAAGYTYNIYNYIDSMYSLGVSLLPVCRGTNDITINFYDCDLSSFGVAGIMVADFSGAYNFYGGKLKSITNLITPLSSMTATLYDVEVPQDFANANVTVAIEDSKQTGFYGDVS